MTDREWVLLRSQGLVDAQLMLHTAFLARLYWWRFLPIVGLFTSWRHEKLLRVGAYLCDQMGSVLILFLRLAFLCFLIELGSASGFYGASYISKRLPIESVTVATGADYLRYAVPVQHFTINNALLFIDRYPSSMGKFERFSVDYSLGIQTSSLGIQTSSFGRFLRGGNRITQDLGLNSRFRFLLLDSLPGDPQQFELHTTSYRQKKSKEPRLPVVNMVKNGLLPVLYREGRDASEGYAVLALLSCYFACMFGVFWGMCRVSDGHRWSGRMIVALAIAVGLAAAITGASGRLPWQWIGCLRQGQQKTEYRQILQHNSTIMQELQEMRANADPEAEV